MKIIDLKLAVVRAFENPFLDSILDRNIATEAYMNNEESEVIGDELWSKCLEKTEKMLTEMNKLFNLSKN